MSSSESNIIMKKRCMSSLLDLVEMEREREVWSKYQGQISTTLNRYGSYTTFIDGSKSEDRLCISEQKADCGWQSSPVNFDLHCRVVCHLDRRNQADYFVKQSIGFQWCQHASWSFWVGGLFILLAFWSVKADHKAKAAPVKTCDACFSPCSVT